MVERWDWRGKQELDHKRSPVFLHNKEFRNYLKARWEITKLSSKRGS